MDPGLLQSNRIPTPISRFRPPNISQKSCEFYEVLVTGIEVVMEVSVFLLKRNVRTFILERAKDASMCILWMKSARRIVLK